MSDGRHGITRVYLTNLYEIDVVSFEPDFMALDDPGRAHDRYSGLHGALAST